MTAPLELCDEIVRGESTIWSRQRPRCGKPVKENGMCGIHAGAAKRRAANEARRTAGYEADKERREKSSVVARQLREHCGELPGVEWSSGRLTLSYNAAVKLVATLSAVQS